MNNHEEKSMHKTMKRGALLFALLFASPAAMSAQPDAYPVRPVRMIVPYPPGGGNDIIGRIVADKLTGGLGQQVVVDNRGGAATVIGADIAKNAAPDGYTVLLATVTTLAVNPALHRKLPYDPRKDFAPISRLASQPYLLVANPSHHYKTVSDLLRDARAHPGKLTFGSPGAGSNGHLAGELMKALTHIDMVHVPYKGTGPALTDLLSGQIALMFATMPSVQGFVKQGKLTGIAVSTAKRSPAMPDVPTIAESGVPGYEMVSWNGLLVPAGTAGMIVARLNREVTRVLDAPDVRARLTQRGFDPDPTTPAEFAQFIDRELARYRDLVKSAGMTAQ
jgi:tripartite-type tricarboxylate transporter receptor subunit TctC